MTSLKLEQNLAPLRIPFKDILIATKDFAKENLIDQGGIADVYKGLLLRSGVPIDVVIRRFCRPCPGLEKQHFLKEINTLSSLKHSNFVSIVGFCDENDEMMIIMERADNGSLENHLSDPTTLTWSRRLYICVGVALALRYVHSDVRNVFHHDIKSSKILLNKEWFAKLFCFGFFVRYRVVFRYTSVYTDPDYIKTGICREDRSDAYSLGVILLEVLCGKKATIEDVIRYRDQMELEEGKLDNIYIDPNLREQMHMQSLSMFSKTAYDCLKEERNQRPSIDEIVERLQIALELQVKHENRARNVDYLRIPLREITMATDCFAETYLIRSHIHDHVYKAELNHFDRDNVLTKEGENKGELPKKKVIIKRIYNYKKSKEDFLAEIQMISSYKHPNLIPLLGFCDEESEMIVVFECAFKETLHHYLRSTSNRTNLTWEQRIRICLDITHGLKYLHNMMEDKLSVIHQRIQSANVFFDEKLTAKIVCFKLFESYGTSSLWDSAMDAPSDFSDQRCVENDIYSLGLILFEILTGRLAEDTARRHFNGGTLRNIADPGLLEEDPGLLEEAQEWSCTRRKGPNQDSFDIFSENQCLEETPSKRPKLDEVINSLEKEPVKGLVHVARRHFDKGTLWNIADPDLMEEAQEWSCTPRKGPNQDSFDIFSEIAYQCSEETPSKRPKLDDVISSLQKAFRFQAPFDHMKIPLDAIQLATNNFDEKYLIGSGGFGEVYKAELKHVNIRCSLAAKMKSEDEYPKLPNTVAIKRIFHREDGQGKEGFLAELEVLSKWEHPNIVNLLGICVERDERLLVYEHASNGSLDGFLGSNNNMINLTWAQRLRVCIDIAHGLSYLHTTMVDKKWIIHRDIKSDNILLGENWEAKIADFGLSKYPANQQESTINTNHIAGTYVYLDPEYARTGRLKKESDIYSFGVVLFEIFSGTLAYDPNYIKENEKGLAPIIQRHFQMGTIKEMLDTKIMEEADELGFTGKVGPDHDSLKAFLKIAYQCLAKAQGHRPTTEVIITELSKALHFQENRIKTLKISLEDIKLGVKNFSVDNCIVRGGYGMLYNGEIQYNKRRKKVLVKRFCLDKYLKHTKFSCFMSMEHGFMKEFEVLFKHKQENIIGLVGYCKEMNEKIIVYENASNGSLDKYLNDASFSWTERLKVCIDIAKGLRFLHGDDVGKDVVIHRDIKSSNILLNKDWNAKICGFELALTYPIDEVMKYAIDHVVGSPGYCDPLYWETHMLTKESDMYSFGVVLFEILCGRLACPKDFRDQSQFLDVLVKRQFKVARLDEIVFEGIKEKIAPKSLSTFRRIAFRCLHEDRKERPTAGQVLVQLQEALEIQEAYVILEGAKLRSNYKEVLRFSNSTNYSTMAKRYINDILSKGILLEEDKQEIIRVLQQPT